MIGGGNLKKKYYEYGLSTNEPSSPNNINMFDKMVNAAYEDDMTYIWDMQNFSLYNKGKILHISDVPTEFIHIWTGLFDDHYVPINVLDYTNRPCLITITRDHTITRWIWTTGLIGYTFKYLI